MTIVHQSTTRYKITIFILIGIIFCLLLQDYTAGDIAIPSQLIGKITKEKIPDGCACSDSNGQTFNFCYSNPQNGSVIGAPFNCSHMEALQELGLLNSTYLNLTTDEFPEPQFVNAISGNHIIEGRKQLNNIHSLWPNRTIIVYNLGLGKYKEEYEKNPLVQLREFPFEKYPEYVENLKEYRWKPIVIAETLKEFGAIFYIDSSIHFKTADLEPVYNLLRCRNKHATKIINETYPDYVDKIKYSDMVKSCNKSSYLFHVAANHSIFAVTHQGMYNYLPVNFDDAKKVSMYAAGVVTVVRTKEAVENILKWYVLCALEENCMAPTGAKLKCKFGGNTYSEYANCHRFDQSAVNLLAANLFGADTSLYGREMNGYLDVSRV